MRTLKDREQLFAQHEAVAFHACNTWCRKNSGFVVRYRLDRDDLDGIALAAVWYATELWEPAKGKFSTIATLAVHSRLSHVLRNKQAARRGRGEVEPLSCDALVAGSEGGGVTLADTLPAPRSACPEWVVLGECNHGDLWAAVATLSPLQAQALRLRYADDLSVQEAAAIMGGSPQMVSKHAGKGIAKLRAALGVAN